MFLHLECHPGPSLMLSKIQQPALFLNDGRALGTVWDRLGQATTTAKHIIHQGAVQSVICVLRAKIA
jgi:hypothetical protein